ncbi:hypothetical protein BV25DRAFT_978029 [Artomyces pyxidatus]|uniref:Uncharacterized protein n=1 Tax=Artomyces pyxidatus TaxID=48021 RepID=A0ACB8SVR8_9AGAM|nr:hypothetical protein BV25DRAFT_978029 [Artomyces pyxidatus]
MACSGHAHSQPCTRECFGLRLGLLKRSCAAYGHSTPLCNPVLTQSDVVVLPRTTFGLVVRHPHMREPRGQPVADGLSSALTPWPPLSLQDKTRRDAVVGAQPSAVLLPSPRYALPFLQSPMVLQRLPRPPPRVRRNPAKRVLMPSGHSIHTYGRVSARPQMTAHNRVASRLSPEIMEMVFWFAAVAWPASKRAGEGRRYDLGWIRVTHVCRYWREVALHNYRLWLEISLDEVSAPWRSAMLVRSRNRPLALSVDLRQSEPDRRDDLVSAIVEDSTIRRTRHLEVQLPLGRDAAFQVVVDVFMRSQPAPLLESLDMTNNPTNPPCAIPPSASAPGMPYAPNLKFLRLVDCYIDWSDHRFEALTHIDIQITRFPMASYEHAATPYDLVNGLRRMPALETLRLFNVFRELDDHERAMGPLLLPKDVAKLPNLTELWLFGPTRSCIELVIHLEYPATTRVTMRTGGPATLDLPQLLSRLPTMRTLRLDFRDRAAVLMKLWAVHHDHESVEKAIPDFDLRIERSPVHEPQANYVSGNPLQGLNLRNLSSLIYDASVGESDLWSEVRWRELLAPAVNIKALHLIDQRALAGSILALTNPVEGKHTSICGPDLMMLFPVLKMLSFSGFTVNPNKFLVDGLPLLETLYRCIEIRRARECKIEMIMLPGPIFILFPPEIPRVRLEELLDPQIRHAMW